MTNVRNKSGVEIRAAACAQGLPPMVALATQISARINGNIVAYRGSHSSRIISRYFHR